MSGFTGDFLRAVDVLGYLASCLVLLTFCMRTMMPLRLTAISSNVLFALFGYFAHIYPIMVLHLILFPVNIMRLVQIQRLVRSASPAQLDGFSLVSLLPFMSRRDLLAGTKLVTRGDEADKLYYLMEGHLEIEEFGKVVGPGSVVGEIGIFAPDHKRTATVMCRTDCVIYELTERKTRELFFQNPAFSYALLQLIIARLSDNQQQSGVGSKAMTKSQQPDPLSNPTPDLSYIAAGHPSNSAIGEPQRRGAWKLSGLRRPPSLSVN